MDSLADKYEKTFFIIQFKGNHGPYNNFHHEQDKYHPNPVTDHVGWDIDKQETPSSKRKINFSLSKSKKKSPSPSLLLSNEISNFANNTSLSKGKIKTVTPNKTILFSNPIDNFYFNVLDMYDISKIALGTRTSIHLYNANLNLPHVNSIEIDGEPLCVHFLSSTSLIHSSSNNDIIMTDLNKIKSYPIMTNHRPILAMDSNLSVIFCGDDNGIIESIDIRTNRNTQRKISILYSHERNNEICKIRYSKSNNCIISGGNDNRANLFDLRKNSIRFTMKHKAETKGPAGYRLFERHKKLRQWRETIL